MTYTPTHFRTQQLVPKSIFSALGQQSLILMDATILWTIDKIRDWFNSPITINDWYKGGQFDQRGFRNDANTGATYSQHRYGRAIDFDVAGRAAQQVRQRILNRQSDPAFQYITVIQTKVNWVHIDCRNMARVNGQIMLVKP